MFVSILTEGLELHEFKGQTLELLNQNPDECS
jgi:hypothetical protein